MLDATGEPISTAALLRVDIEYRGRAATYWVGRDGFAEEDQPAAALFNFYQHAGGLKAALAAFDARDEPVSGSLIQRVASCGGTVAQMPEMTAFVPFRDHNDRAGEITITYCAPGNLPDVPPEGPGTARP